MTEKTDDLIRAVRNFWDARPCNIRHSEKPLGTREYFDEVETKKYRAEPHIRSFADFKSWRGKNVLEIGCGIGTDTINFARHGAQVTAVDLSPVSLDIARKRAEVYDLSKAIQFYHVDGERLSNVVPLKTYDLVYSFGVIHHTPTPENIIQEIRSYMGPESELRIMVYSKFSYKLFWLLHELGEWQLGKAERLVTDFSEAQSGCPVTHTYTFEEVAELLAGFTITNMEKDHIFPWNIDKYNKHVFEKDPVWEGVSDEYFRKMEKELGWHTLVKARLDCGSGKAGQ